MENQKYPEPLVFGLDIGTRSIVGTVGYRDNNRFVVVAQCIREHETRAMMDGQIHDIIKVSETIREVKEALETQIELRLTEVCIAAAGRVLKTVKVNVEYEFPAETTVSEDHIRSLDLIGVEKAYSTLREELKEHKKNFYCIGYSVISYTLNGYSMIKINGHKAKKIGTELLATFLPDEVINGLYTAVESANLQVASLTLEPIAAISVAIPEKFRLLNIAMVDVGAGTSDISITKDGSIIAYGMIPEAGDEITDAIAQKYLVEFKVAETMKTACLKKKKVSFKDVMGAAHKIDAVEIMEAVSETVHKMTRGIADKIIELNGGKSVSAVFVVGGGGKFPGFITDLADYLKLPQDRVALRGEDVLQSVTFLQDNVKKDSLMVTPIGICLHYYDQSNNFIFVTVNGERIKLYDNGKLTISDAAIQLGYPNEYLFPRRGKPINFTFEGTPRQIKGGVGEAASIKLNGETVGITHSISHNDRIEIIESTSGNAASYEIRRLPEYHSTIDFFVNGSKVLCPKFVLANGNLVSEYYGVQNNDEIKILNHYTVKQLQEFMDIDFKGGILVNNLPADMETIIYDKDSIQFNLKSTQIAPEIQIDKKDSGISRNGSSLVSMNASKLNISGLDLSLKPSDKSISLGNNLSKVSATNSTSVASNNFLASNTSGASNPPAIDINVAASEDASSTGIYSEEYITEHSNKIALQFMSLSSSAPLKKDLIDDRSVEVKAATKIDIQKVNEVNEVQKGKEVSKNEVKEELNKIQDIYVTVNSKVVKLSDKEKYIFVDILDFYPFDLSSMKGSELVTMLNGEKADFTSPIQDKDKLELYWKS